MLDFSDHRVIGIIVGVSIALLSLITIFIKYLVHRHKKKKEQE